jgi:hypothetical protein
MSNEQESEMMSNDANTLNASQTIPDTTTHTASPNASSTANTSTSSMHGAGGTCSNTTSANVTQTQASSSSSSVCCGDFLDTLNKPVKNILVTVKFITHEKFNSSRTMTMNNNNSSSKERDEANLSSSSSTSSFNLNEVDDTLSKKLIVNSSLNEADVVSFINYCNTWPQRYALYYIFN